MPVMDSSNTDLRIQSSMPALASTAEIDRSPGALIDIESLDFHYGPHQVLHEISLQIPERQVTAFIGPSGCGKSTLLRCLNRMNDLIDGARVGGGRISIRGIDIHRSDVDVIELRKRVGMVFQKSNPFPKSIYENVAYGLRIRVSGTGHVWMKPWSGRCWAQDCGTKSRIACMHRVSGSRVDSNSDSASRARSRWSLRLS